MWQTNSQGDEMENFSDNDVNYPLLARCPHQACWIISRPAASSSSRVQRWTQQVLFMSKTVRFELAEPLMILPPSRFSSFHVVITCSLLAWNGMFQTGQTRWPDDPRCRLLTTYSRMKPSVSKCLPVAHSPCWDLLLAPEFIHPRAGQTLWQSNLKGSTKSARSPQQGKLSLSFSQPIFLRQDGFEQLPMVWNRITRSWFGCFSGKRISE